MSIANAWGNSTPEERARLAKAERAKKRALDKRKLFKELSWSDRMMKDPKFKRAVEDIQRYEIKVPCGHCGAMLFVNARTGEVDSSFGPVRADESDVTQYRFLKVEEKKGKRARK